MNPVTHIMAFLEQPGTSAFSGAENHLAILMKAQAQAGQRVELCALAYSFEEELVERLNELSGSGIEIQRFKLKKTDSWIIHQAREARLVFELGNFLKSRKNNIVHAHMDLAGRVGRLAARKAGCKNIVISFHNNPPSYASGTKKAELLFLDRFTSRSIAISGAVHELLVDTVGIPSEKVDVIRYGLASPALPRPSDVLRDEIGIPRDAFVAGLVGRLTEQKNIPLFINALERLPDVFGVIVGAGKLESELRGLAESKGIRNIKFLGYRANSVEITSCFDVFCLPSRWEGLGLVLIEAMFQNVPIIGSRAGAIPEILSNGEYGLLFDSDDLDGLIRNIEHARDNRQEMLDMAERAKDYAGKTFTVDAMLSRTTAFYDKVLNDKN